MKLRIFLLALAIPFIGFSQASDFGNWMIYFGNYQASPKWNWHNEVQYRNFNAIGNLEQLLIRTGIGYNLTENNNNLLLGYGMILENEIPENADAPVIIKEHRIYQQFITKQKAGRFYWGHRYRFEQRFVQDVFKMRLRYFVNLNVPLNHRELLDKTVYLSAYNELFAGVIKSSVFDRNRLYGGLGYKMNSKIKFELGYMNQFLSKVNRDQLNIVAFINF